MIDDITMQKLHVCQQLLTSLQNIGRKWGKKKKWLLHTADFSDGQTEKDRL